MKWSSTSLNTRNQTLPGEATFARVPPAPSEWVNFKPIKFALGAKWIKSSLFIRRGSMYRKANRKDLLPRKTAAKYKACPFPIKKKKTFLQVTEQYIEFPELTSWKNVLYKIHHKIHYVFLLKLLFWRNCLVKSSDSQIS